ncbi:DNA-formamidopyrimidine glycosylase family protein [Stutzerimonas azotifigens]|uniref:DNA-formamidopyrimidine glycosylase family protein n=1 Tax=Stutzerimonas azotifigens TaxID=291995 RepID=UPI0003F509DF|nr:DNA-formamidopyrimidine glycosylase family protein [Stutzerimonas azotifigens]
MPEGPSIVILREETARFVGQPVREVSGNSRLDQSRLLGQTVRSMRSYGKQFLIEFDAFSLRVHFLLFGSYRIDELKESGTPRLSLVFPNGALHLYACSVQYLDQPLEVLYDWRTDVMSDIWDPALARKKLRARPNLLACDALLDQELFAGSGNIIKNEVLFRIRVHPLSTVGALPPAKLRELVQQVRVYSFQFLEWKKAFELKKHWLAHTRSTCPRCHIPLVRAHLGRSDRRSFFCERCQKRYGAVPDSQSQSPEE